MNKRTKELFQEAYTHFGQGKYFTQELLAEKFAELMVKDCVNIIETLSPGYNDYRNQIEDAFRRDCVEQVKEHFGVEE